MIKKILIISHRDADGITSAVSYIWNYLEINNISKNTANIYKYSNIIDFQYEEDILKIFSKKKININNYKQIILLDLSLPKEIMISFFKKFKKDFIWIDHHKGPNKDFEKYFSSKNIKINGIRDSNHAACFLVWKFFKKGAPEFVEYIQDMDLWKFKKEDSKYFIAGLKDLKEEYKRTNIKYILDLINFDNFSKQKKKIIEKGKTIYEHQRNHVLSSLYAGKIINFSGRKTFIINTLFFASVFADFFFNHKDKKYKDVEILIIWNKEYKTGLFKFSLRKKESSKIDLSKIAKKYGGGGHPSAAAFNLKDLSKLNFKDY